MSPFRKTAAVLALALAVSLGGCRTQPAEREQAMADTVTLCMACSYDYEDAALIEEAINEVTEEKYGIRIRLMILGMGGWPEQVNLLMTGNEVDIVMIFNTPLTTYVNNNQLHDLSEYYDSASDDFRELWSAEQLRGTSVNGRLYAVPNLRNFGNRMGLNIDAQIAAEYGIEDGRKWTLEEVDLFLRRVHDDYPDKYAVVPQSSSLMVGGWTWDGLGDGNFIGVLPQRGQVTEVQNLFETEDFLEFVSYSRSWFEDGLMMQDAMSNLDYGSDLIQRGAAVSCFDNYANNAVAGCIRTLVVEEWSVANSYSELCYGINALSDQPDAAWKMLEILYTDEEVGILLNNGIEGRHYVKNEDGTVSFPEGLTQEDNGWGMSPLYWLPPYSGNAYPLDVNGAGFFEDLVQFNETTLKSQAHGFYFDPAAVVDEYLACVNIMDKYYQAILVGAVETRSALIQVNRELKEAGLEDIIREKQKQLDLFLSSQRPAD